MSDTNITIGQKPKDTDSQTKPSGSTVVRTGKVWCIKAYIFDIGKKNSGYKNVTSLNMQKLISFKIF